MPSRPSTNAHDNDAALPASAETSFSARLFRRLSRLSAQDRIHAWVQANQFVWPDALAEFKPIGWELLESARKFDNQDGKALIRCLEALTCDYDRSRQWNIEIADNNVEGHLEWYIAAHFSK